MIFLFSVSQHRRHEYVCQNGLAQSKDSHLICKIMDSEASTPKQFVYLLHTFISLILDGCYKFPGLLTDVIPLFNFETQANFGVLPSLKQNLIHTYHASKSAIF
jgi:hypothetical protein